MQLKTLKSILESELDLPQENGHYKSQEGQQIAFYIGKPGNAMVINNVLSIVLKNDYMKLETKNQTTYCVTYDHVHAVSNKKEKKTSDSRSSVGFE